MLRRLVLATAFLGACSVPGTGHVLGELDTAELRARVVKSAGRPAQLLVELEYAMGGLASCDLSLDVKARAGDAELRGPESYRSLSTRGCGVRFRGDLPIADGPTRIEVEDDSGSLAMEVEGLGAERRVELVVPRGGTITPGDEVVLEWSPGTDRLDHASIETWFQGPSNEPMAQRAKGTLNQVRFTASLDERGSGFLFVSGSEVEPAVTSCEGASSCSAEVATTLFAVPVTLR